MQELIKRAKSWCKSKKILKPLINWISSWRKTKRIVNGMKIENKKYTLKDEKESLKYINKPGIALTFDDGYRVIHWYKYGFGEENGYSDFFGYFDVKATFTINALHQFENRRELNQKEIDMLLELQSNGHELAHHGYGHKNAVEYINNHGVREWIAHEIIPLFEWMDNKKHSKTGEKFKVPVSYAYPGSRCNAETNIHLKDYFGIIRGHLEGNNLTGFENRGFCPSICIDINYFPYISHVKKIIKYAKKSNRNLVLMCHSILPDHVSWDDFGWGEDMYGERNYRISPNSLKYIINEARKSNLEFYTLSEIAGIATFIDNNLEGGIRRIVNKPRTLYKWIYIKDLVSITQLDLSNLQIKSLGGIEYFINLEELNLSNNKIDDIRILRKLEKLKKLNISNNIINKAQLYEDLFENNRKRNIETIM
jgi:peptidoglycan/xylan/chitin deacetylase (PgdA/CDA1 family)